MHRLILASGSPQRKRILKALYVPFSACPSQVEETHRGLKKPEAICRHLALKKALSVAKRYPRDWVLGVDTLVVLSNKRISGKPKNKKGAQMILKSYSGSFCEVYSGIALINASMNKKFVQLERSELRFNRFTQKEIDGYLQKNEWQGSSGAMTIEGIPRHWLKKLEGDYWNVVGLPLKPLKEMMNSLACHS